MIGGMRKRARQLLSPVVERLPFARIDQVERHAAETLLGEVERGKRFAHRMLTPQRPQALIVERLHPKRQPVDPGCGVAREVLRLDARRVRLERDLGVRIDNPVPGDRLEDRRDRGGLHEGRRAATEEDA